MLRFSNRPEVAAVSEASAKITPLENGPLMVSGDVQVEGSHPRSAKDKPVYLCRCGGSKNKPYCDGTHKTISFQAPGAN